MSAKFKNKYRIDSSRMKHWNYGWQASYYITICTHDRICFFGDVVNGEMVLNDIGQIVESEWLKTFEMRPDMNLTKGAFVVMPNHFHAIIGIGKNKYNTKYNNDALRNDAIYRDAMHCVSDVVETTIHTANKFGPQSKNLASIVRGFKIGVTKNARLIDPNFAWQSRYHDHIIRNEKSFQKITEYIMNNPKNWSEDEHK